MSNEMEKYDNYNSEIRNELMYGFTVEQAKFCVKKEHTLLDRKIIRICFKAGLTIEQAKFCINNKLNEDQRYQIYLGLKHGLEIEQIKLYASAKFSEKQMNEIRQGFENGLDTNQISIYANPKFNDKQMGAIRLSFERHLPMEAIKIIANEKFNDKQMNLIMSCFEAGFSIEDVKLCANPIFSFEQMAIIKDCIERGFSSEEIEIVISENYDYKEMKLVMLMIDSNIPLAAVKFFINHKKQYSINDVFRWLSRGLLYEYIVDCINLELSHDQIDEISEMNPNPSTPEETISMCIDEYAKENSEKLLHSLEEMTISHTLNFVIVSDDIAKNMVIQAHQAFDLLPTNQKYTKEFEDILLTCYGEGFTPDDPYYFIPPYFSEDDIFDAEEKAIDYKYEKILAYPELLPDFIYKK